MVVQLLDYSCAKETGRTAVEFSRALMRNRHSSGGAGRCFECSTNCVQLYYRGTRR